MPDVGVDVTKGQSGMDGLRVYPRATSSRWRLWLGLVLMVVLAALALLWSHSSWAPYDRDDYYYLIETLRRVGVPYDVAIRRAAAFFHDPALRAPFVLDYGMLNPTLAPMIYPRVVFTTVAQPFVAAAGARGIYVPGIVFGCLTVVLVTLLAKRRIGGAGAVLMPMFLVGSTLALDFLFGMYTEAPVITCVAAMLWFLPLGGNTRRGWPAAAAVAGLVPIMLLSRQVPVLPVAMVAGGWLWASVGERRLNNAWWPFVVTVTSTAAVCYLGLNVWAPYNPLPFLRLRTHSSSLAETLTKLPSHFAAAMQTDIVHMLQHDPLGVALSLLVLGGVAILRRHPLVGVVVGAELAGLLTVFLNGNPTFGRYESPALPAVALLGAATVQYVWCRLRGEPFKLLVSAEASSSAPATARGYLPANVRKYLPANARKYMAAAAIWSLTVALVCITVVGLQPAVIDPAKSVAVSSATTNHWPFTVPSGRLVCAGDDYQVWFDGSDGQRYAFSGTAMAHSFLTPRVMSIRQGSAAFEWAPGLALLDRGMQLCQAGRHYRRPPVRGAQQR